MSFGGLVVEYDDSVITPRAWTETQSRWAAEVSERVEPGRILELCCGAGHIGLEAARLSGRSTLQVDLDPDACWFARRNSRLAGLSNRVEVVRCDLRTMLRTAERFPLVIADPPYLPTQEVGTFADDPRHAIDGGPDGIRLLIDCLTVIDSVLTPGGLALLQLRGRRQADQLMAWIPSELSVVELREHDSDRAVALLRRPTTLGCDGGAGRVTGPRSGPAG